MDYNSNAPGPEAVGIPPECWGSIAQGQLPRDAFKTNYLVSPFCTNPEGCAFRKTKLWPGNGIIAVLNYCNAPTMPAGTETHNIQKAAKGGLELVTLEIVPEQFLIDIGPT